MRQILVFIINLKSNKKLKNSMGKFSDIWKKINEIDMRVKKLEKPKSAEIKKLSLSTFEDSIKQQVPEIGIQHLILLILKLKSKQSRANIKSKLNEWKKPIGRWFRGGNFNNRLLKKKFVIVDGKNKEGDELYSLGMRGVKAVNELIKKYNLS